MKKLYFAARRFWTEEKGVTAIEYGLIAALVAIVLITILTTVGGDLVDLFEEISLKLKGAIPTE
jgi:pilus assembly protein Flp/PilA